MVSRSLTFAGLALTVLGIVVLFGSIPSPAAPAVPVGASQPAAAASSTAAPTAEPGQVVPPPPPPTVPRRIPDGYRIQIPRLGIDLPIQEGDITRDIEQQKTPENFAFHLPGTAIFGESGNTYLYAHARVGMFLSLWNAREGDLVLISTPAGNVLRYAVREVHRAVPPTDVSPAQPTSSERLTLQTSTGPNAGDPRFVVIALPSS
ncbi:MAG: sortase [Chloroflexota bacterium]|nr:sortase [Chloroflexota bacterium]